MLRQSYIGDGNPYGIGNFGGCNCGGDFMASYSCAIFAGGITVTPLPGGGGDSGSGSGGTGTNTTASNIPVQDVNDYFAGDNVETILSEVGSKLQKAIIDIQFTDDEEFVFTMMDGKKINLGGIPAKLEAEVISGGGAPIN